jgi:hypothetical protein
MDIQEIIAFVALGTLAFLSKNSFQKKNLLKIVQWRLASILKLSTLSGQFNVTACFG